MNSSGLVGVTWSVARAVANIFSSPVFSRVLSLVFIQLATDIPRPPPSPEDLNPTTSRRGIGSLVAKMYLYERYPCEAQKHTVSG